MIQFAPSPLPLSSSIAHIKYKYKIQVFFSKSRSSLKPFLDVMSNFYQVLYTIWSA